MAAAAAAAAEMAAMRAQMAELGTSFKAQVEMTTLLQQQVVSQQATIKQQAESAAASAAAAQAAASAPATGAPKGRTVSIDTKLLGRPDIFDGKEEKWPDWSMVFRAYAGILGEHITPGLSAAESGEVVLNSALPEPEKKESSKALFFTLVMLCRGEPLSIIENAGQSEGFHS